ncbi:MAG: YdcF family protein [Rickettsiales bacterium]|jgi:uncharacterized SAM-binding protein YcdF (DUF218 family)|nr:YdcF family protein [Rickettsiales bacterium]
MMDGEYEVIRKKRWLDDARAKKLILFSAAGLLVYLAGFALFVARLDFEAGVGAVERSDAVIVFTGDGRRIREGLAEFGRGRARRLFISGIESKRLAPSSLGKGNIELGVKARNTIENAMESALWARAGGVESIVLITSFYHMPRAVLALGKYMPEAKITPFPVSHGIKGSWQAVNTPWALKLSFKEYNKYLAFWAWTRLGFDDALLNRIK